MNQSSKEAHNHDHIKILTTQKAKNGKKMNMQVKTVTLPETETFEKPTAVVVVIRSHTTQLLLQKTPE